MSSCKSERVFKSEEFCILRPNLTNDDSLISFYIMWLSMTSMLCGSENGSEVRILVLMEAQLSSPGLFGVNSLFYYIHLQCLSFTNLKGNE